MLVIFTISYFGQHLNWSEESWNIEYLGMSWNMESGRIPARESISTDSLVLFIDEKCFQVWLRVISHKL